MGKIEFLFRNHSISKGRVRGQEQQTGDDLASLEATPFQINTARAGFHRRAGYLRPQQMLARILSYQLRKTREL